MAKRSTVGFELSVSGRNDGTLEAAYIQVANRAVARTKEVVEDILLADYDARGRLVGVEILAPVKLSDLVRLVDRSRRTPLRRFVKTSVPRELVTV